MIQRRTVKKVAMQLGETKVSLPVYTMDTTAKVKWLCKSEKNYCQRLTPKNPKLDRPSTRSVFRMLTTEACSHCHQCNTMYTTATSIWVKKLTGRITCVGV